jgi:putative ABC transport system ATP-binding protein
MKLITIAEMTKYYAMGLRKFFALKGIDLTIENGEFTGIVEPSGSGKTTLLNIIGTLDSQISGKVEVPGHTISDLSSIAAARLRC